MPTTFDIHCANCPYFKGQHLPEPYRQMRGVPLSLEDNSSRVLLVFLAPGIEEWRLGKPICSTRPHSAGMKLAKAFSLSDKTRKDYNITNAVQCFPGKQESRNGKTHRDKTPPKDVRDHCSKWLHQDIEANKYLQIIVFGREARKVIGYLGYEDDSRFKFAPHPTASGVSINGIHEVVS